MLDISLLCYYYAVTDIRMLIITIIMPHVKQEQGLVYYELPFEFPKRNIVKGNTYTNCANCLLINTPIYYKRKIERFDHLYLFGKRQC